MAILELLLRGSFAGQECINRWNYVSSGTPAAVSLSFALTSAFGVIPAAGIYPAGSPFRLIKDELNVEFKFEEVQVKDVYSVTDFYTRPFVANTTGSMAGEASPPFLSYGFRTNRVRSDIRRGTKRFAGVIEGAVGPLGIIGTAVMGHLQAIADAMSDVLTYIDEGNTISFTPAVCGKEKYTTPEGNEAYRYYASESSQLAHTATGVLWEAYPEVRSQVSRQYGRGR